MQSRRLSTERMLTMVGTNGSPPEGACEMTATGSPLQQDKCIHDPGSLHEPAPAIWPFPCNATETATCESQMAPGLPDLIWEQEIFLTCGGAAPLGGRHRVSASQPLALVLRPARADRLSNPDTLHLAGMPGARIFPDSTLAPAPLDLLGAQLSHSS